MHRPAFSLIVPAYNEAERLSTTLPRMVREVVALFPPETAEIVVVNDGSSDDTAERASELLADFPARVVSYAQNRGKGYAVREGMLAARGAIRLFTDADLSTPLSEIPRFLEAHRRGASVVIGSRKRPGAKVDRRQPLLRESMGRVFTFLSNVLVVSGVTDFTCGFKSFTAEAAERVFPRIQLTDWTFDTELLWLVRRAGFSLREVPVRWEDDPRTRVRRLSATVHSLAGLARLTIRRSGLGPANDLERHR